MFFLCLLKSLVLPQPLKGNETTGEATNAAAPSRAKDERIKMYLGSHCTIEFFYFMFPRGFGGIRKPGG